MDGDGYLVQSKANASVQHALALGWALDFGPMWVKKELSRGSTARRTPALAALLPPSPVRWRMCSPSLQLPSSTLSFTSINSFRIAGSIQYDDDNSFLEKRWLFTPLSHNHQRTKTLFQDNNNHNKRNTTE